jgi:hypothetical protein
MLSMRNKLPYLRAGTSLIVLLLLFSCSSSRNSVPQEKKNETSRNVLPPAPVPLSPGIARTMALPLIYRQEGQVSVCTLRIERVTGYGMSTPVLTVGSEIQALVDLTTDQQTEILISAWNKARTVNLILESMKTGLAESTGPAWKIVDIELQSEKK